MSYYTVEVRVWHMHARGQELQVNPDVWSDYLHHLLPDGPWPQSCCSTLEQAHATIERLKYEADIPVTDIQLTKHDAEILPIPQ